MKGICYLVGGGPGDLGLFTLKAKRLIEQADIIAYDFLVNRSALNWARSDAKLVSVGKRKNKHTIPQEKICRLLVNWVKKGKRVVRLKGGDPFLFARGGEEAEALVRAKCKFEVVPGITAGISAATYAGIPVSSRIYNSTITFVTGHEAPSKEKTSIDWNAIAKLDGTTVVYMGMAKMDFIVRRLIQEGMNKKKPIAVIEWGTTARQRTVTGSLQDISQKVKKEKLKAPAIIVIGDVVNFRKKFHWFEEKPLFGKRIVVTRSRAQTSKLREMLEEKSAEVLELPTIKIVPQLPKKKVDIAKYNWLIFASPNGVECFFDWFLKKNDIRDLGKIKIAALGPATADAVRCRGLKVNFVPKIFTSEGLVKEWKNSKHSQTALYPCSDWVRDEIRNGLKKKNIKVDQLQVYKTISEKEDRGEIKERLKKEGADWILFTSSSTVENFHKLKLGKLSCKYASLGPITSKTLRRLGYPVHLQARESRLESLVEQVSNQTS